MDIVEKNMFFLLKLFQNFLKDNKKIMGLRLVEKREAIKSIKTIILKNIKKY